MENLQLSSTIKVLSSPAELPAEYALLLEKAKQMIPNAYAPYSNFLVGAAVLLSNGITVTGNNQENASFPVGMCAERVTLSSASALYPEAVMKALAVTATGREFTTNEPISPCGICRQTILEYEIRHNHPIEIILQGAEGKIYLIKSVKDILPLYFDSGKIKKKPS